MSKVLIEQYYNNLDRAVQFGKTKNESSVKYHFWNLLNDYARKRNYKVATKVICIGTKGKTVRPNEAWEYKLGNRSALEWILDQYKESAPKDKTIAEKVNAYRFADYKEHVIELWRRVCTVSVETVSIVREMEAEEM